MINFCFSDTDMPSCSFSGSRLECEVGAANPFYVIMCPSLLARCIVDHHIQIFIGGGEKGFMPSTH